MGNETRPLHVLMILESAFPSATGGGAEAQVRTLALGLRAKGHRVTVVTPLVSTGPDGVVGRVDGIPVCRLRYPYFPLLGGLVLWMRLAMFLWNRRLRYDAWHVHIAHHLGAVCALMGNWINKPVLLKVSGWWELEHGVLANNAAPLSRLAYVCLRRATAWQAISTRIAASLVAKGIPPARIVAIPNAVDTVRFRGIQRTPAPSPRFVFIGRLVPEKGLDVLLRAFAVALHDHPQATLRLVGSGPLESSLMVLASDLGITGQIEFCGHRNDIEVVLAKSDIGVLASRIEGLSNTLLECMAAGLPMIASKVSGSEDFVRPGETGWLFEPDDQKQLALCLQAAAALPVDLRLEMGKKAREYVENRAGVALVTERLSALYRMRSGAALPLCASGRSS